MSNPLLLAEYNRVVIEVNEMIANSDGVAFQWDGWTNIRQEPIVNVVVTTPTPLLYKSIPTGTESHSGEVMADVVLEIVPEVGKEKVIGGVTDGAAAMVKARRLIKAVYPFFQLFTCGDHNLANLLKDNAKLSFFQDVIRIAKTICVKIRESHLMLGKFGEIQQDLYGCTKALRTPGETRFGSNVITLQSLIDSKEALQQFALKYSPTGTQKRLDPELKRSLLSDDYWDQVDHLFALMLPIFNWITRLESDTPRISEVVKCFSEISIRLEELISKNYLSPADVVKAKEFLRHRREIGVTEIHLAANLLDPKFCGQHLTEPERHKAIEFINEYCKVLPDISATERQLILTELASYTSKQGNFSYSYLWEMAPNMLNTMWWKGYFSTCSLTKVALKILSMPPTSSATERTFSTYGSVHTKSRNRLQNCRAGKLVYIRHNLKTLRKWGKKKVDKILKPKKMAQTKGATAETEVIELDDEEEDSTDGEMDFSENDDDSDISIFVPSEGDAEPQGEISNDEEEVDDVGLINDAIARDIEPESYSDMETGDQD